MLRIGAGGTVALPKLPERTGFSIVELLVSTTIGLGLLLLTTTLYIGSSASFRLNNEHMRLHQDASYALNLMARHVRQAGFGKLVLADPQAGVSQVTDFIPVDGVTASGLYGCDNGYVRPLGAGRNFSCSANPGMASFEVSYRVDDHHDAATGRGADCNGAQPPAIAVPTDHPAYRLAPQVVIARNRFFVATSAGRATNSLYCHGNGNDSAQPIINNIEEMRLTYAVAESGEATPVQFLPASRVDALSGDQEENWRRVVSVKLCLLIRSEYEVTPAPQRYVDCSSTAKLATDRKLRAVLTRVITLRNRAAGTLLRQPEELME
ncbi:hypothetical protein CAter282_3403 [Collimonas arenae]|uniref:Type IV pilus assembly protein PilW n=1 Tax=Collimonas arenae TaxID=279058 RepID=A0A127QM16_9BURK|nr:PilW family protein [Collimonas arenae]AMP01199.1 hypothetical protein CAter10_3729 [Collimonas arenae]AMP11093.1 hypothetical protein CAter282_3403 [Collimonas arenae]